MVRNTLEGLNADEILVRAGSGSTRSPGNLREPLHKCRRDVRLFAAMVVCGKKLCSTASLSWSQCEPIFRDRLSRCRVLLREVVSVIGVVQPCTILHHCVASFGFAPCLYLWNRVYRASISTRRILAIWLDDKLRKTTDGANYSWQPRAIGFFQKQARKTTGYQAAPLRAGKISIVLYPVRVDNWCWARIRAELSN